MHSIFFSLNSLLHRFLSIAFTMLLFIFSRSPGFHFPRDDLSTFPISFVLLFSCHILHPFPLSSPPQRHLARCNPRPISRYPLTCRRFFTRDTFHPSTPPYSFARARVSFLSVRRTLESHKALRRIFHAAISTGRDERRHSSRRPIQSEKWRDLVLNGVGTKFPWPLIRRSW